MTNKEIIDRAYRIVRRRLDDMDGYNDEWVNISKMELINISTALALASILCRINDERNEK